jgi:hypothetical protein
MWKLYVKPFKQNRKMEMAAKRKADDREKGRAEYDAIVALQEGEAAAEAMAISVIIAAEDEAAAADAAAPMAPGAGDYVEIPELDE